MSPGLDIFPMAEFAVGTNNISPITRITIEPTAGINDFTQLIDKNPIPYRTLPKNKALREPNQAIRREIGYWKMMIKMALMDNNRPYCSVEDPILSTVNTDKVEPQLAISKKNKKHKRQKTINVEFESNCFK